METRCAIIPPCDSLSTFCDRVSRTCEQKQSLKSGATALDLISNIIFIYSQRTVGFSRSRAHVYLLPCFIFKTVGTLRAVSTLRCSWRSLLFIPFLRVQSHQEFFILFFALNNDTSPFVLCPWGNNWNICCHRPSQPQIYIVRFSELRLPVHKAAFVNFPKQEGCSF